MRTAQSSARECAPPGMAWIPGGEFRMGSDDFYPEERPAHRVMVDGFWMDVSPVTVTEFGRFVATGYQTVAEQPLPADDCPDANPALLAGWAGKALPAEAEWEFAARGGLDGAVHVWEWTSDYFRPRHATTDGQQAAPCCPERPERNPRLAEPERDLASAIPRRVIKGGSHLCAPSYCLRYRPAARQGGAIDTSTGHLGLRCIERGSRPGGLGAAAG
jgi:formylglycine-generating enzyme